MRRRAENDQTQVRPPTRLFALLWLIPAIALACFIGALVSSSHHARLSAALLQAVNQRDGPRVEHLLTQGADPDVQDWRTYYCKGRIPFRPPWYEKPLAKLMRRRPRPADPYLGPTALMIAAFHGDAAIVQSLLTHGADITRVGTRVEDDGVGRLRPPVAPLFETISTYETILSNGSFVVGSPPGNNVTTALLLIRQGAPVNTRVSGLTPLMLTDRPEIAAALIDRGAEVNVSADGAAENDEGKTPLMFAVDPSPSSSTIDKTDAQRAAMTLLLLNKGANVNAIAITGYGLTALGTAAVCQLPKTAGVLLTHGAKPNLCGPTDDPPLVYAARAKDLGMMAALLSHGANANIRGSGGVTALMLASYPEFVPCLPPHSQWRSRRRALQKLLRQYKADPRLKDQDGHRAADYESMDDPEQVCGP